MKLLRLTLFATLLGLMGCSETQQKATIVGQFIGNVPEVVRTTIPVNGVAFWGFGEPIDVDSTGAFKIELHIGEPAIVWLLAGNTYTLVVEPGQEYFITLDMSSEDKKISIQSPWSNTIEYFNSLPNNFHPQLDELWNLRDLDVEEIERRLEEQIDLEVSPLEEFFLRGEVSEEIYLLLKQEREIYYYTLWGSIASFKNMEYFRANNNATSGEVINFWNRAHIRHPIDKKSITQSPHALWYLKSYLWFKLYSTISVDSITQSRAKAREGNLIHTQTIERAKKILKDDVLEFFTAAYIYSRSYQKHYEKELIALFDQFNAEYPASGYRSFLESVVSEIALFHEKVSGEFKEGILFVEDYQTINSFEELVSSIEGEYIYIDFWATGCGPCKKEFQFNKGLKQMLSSMNVTMLYISVDRDNQHNQWLDMVKFYELEGYNLRANGELRKQLYSLFEISGIPHFALVRNNGEILIRDAKRPSQLEELRTELSRLVL